MTHIKPQDMDGADILIQAHQLITGPRQQAYSHPYDDYSKVRNIFHGMTGINLTVQQAILFMVAVKLARLTTNLDKGRWHQDSIVDAAGYIGCLSMVNAYREERQRELADLYNDEQ